MIHNWDQRYIVTNYRYLIKHFSQLQWQGHICKIISTQRMNSHKNVNRDTAFKWEYVCGSWCIIIMSTSDKQICIAIPDDVSNVHHISFLRMLITTCIVVDDVHTLSVGHWAPPMGVMQSSPIRERWPSEPHQCSPPFQPYEACIVRCWLVPPIVHGGDAVFAN